MSASRTQLTIATVAAVLVIAIGGFFVFAAGDDGDDPSEGAAAGDDVAGESPDQSAGVPDENVPLSSDEVPSDGPPDVDPVLDEDSNQDPDPVNTGEQSAAGSETEDPGDEVVDEHPGLAQFCASVRHQPIAEQNAASGVWVNGAIYGLDEGTWIWVEGPTINGGQGVELPVTDGAFEGPLGINSYGDHELTTFELRAPDADPIDLLPTLADGPGTIFPVDAAEGPVFDHECFDFAR